MAQKSTEVSIQENPTYKVKSPIVGIYYESPSPESPPL